MPGALRERIMLAAPRVAYGQHMLFDEYFDLAGLRSLRERFRRSLWIGQSVKN